MSVAVFFIAFVAAALCIILLMVQGLFRLITDPKLVFALGFFCVAVCLVALHWN